MNGILLDSLPGKKRTHKHRITLLRFRRVLLQFECGTRNLRVVHGRDARATSPNCISAVSPDSLEYHLTSRIDCDFLKRTTANRVLTRPLPHAVLYNHETRPI